MTVTTRFNRSIMLSFWTVKLCLYLVAIVIADFRIFTVAKDQLVDYNYYLLLCACVTHFIAI